MNEIANRNSNPSECQSLPADDIRPGTFVAIRGTILEYPSYYWDRDSHLSEPTELFRLEFHSLSNGTPLKVKAIALPFVFVKLPSGKHRTLDIRQHRLVKLEDAYAKRVWKRLRKQYRRSSR